MNTKENYLGGPLVLLVVSVTLAFRVAAETPASEAKKDSSEPIALGLTFNSISGTTLQTWNSYSSQSQSGWSQHGCSIGYSADGQTKNSMLHVPIISLPNLDNDRYHTEMSRGTLKISRQKAEQEIARLDLQEIAPYAITEKSTIAQRNAARDAESIRRRPEAPLMVESIEMLDNLLGTTFSVENSFRLEEGAELIGHVCRIGYERQKEFVPVLSLPSIEDDFYVVELVEKKIQVAELRSGRSVITLNLEALAPAALTDRLSANGFAPPTTEEDFQQLVEELKTRKKSEEEK